MKIVFVDAASMEGQNLEELKSLGELEFYATSTPEEAIQRVKDAEIIVTNKVVVDKKLLDAANKLRLICEAATGTNNIDLDECKKRGIIVRNVEAYSTPSVAQLSFSLLLNLRCHLNYFDREVKDGTYSASGKFTDTSMPFLELEGKTIGIIGLGNIGKQVAKYAKAFGMRVTYYSNSGNAHCPEYECLDLDSLLSQSDVVSIHAPLNDKTYHLIGLKEFKKMKSDAIIINTGRGGIIVEEDLAYAIDNELIAGAGLDVFEKEPIDKDNPLLKVKFPDRLCLCPHIAWFSKEASKRLAQGVINNIKAGF